MQTNPEIMNLPNTMASVMLFIPCPPLFPSLCVASLLLAGFFDQFLFLKKQWKSHQLPPLYPSFQNDPNCWNPVASLRFQSTAFSPEPICASVWLYLCTSFVIMCPLVASKQKAKKKWTCYILKWAALSFLNLLQLPVRPPLINWAKVTIRSFWITS